MYVYKFINIQEEVIYVGRTNNFKRRIEKEHFTKNGHLPIECYNETNRVMYAQVLSENETKLYELYLIQKYNPKYNTQDTSGGSISFDMPALSWAEYIPQQYEARNNMTKNEIINQVSKLNDDLDVEIRYAMNVLLKDKDKPSWLSKLTPEEQYEYLNTIYSFERYIKSIDEIKSYTLNKIATM